MLPRHWTNWRQMVRCCSKGEHPLSPHSLLSKRRGGRTKEGCLRTSSVWEQRASFQTLTAKANFCLKCKCEYILLPWNIYFLFLMELVLNSWFPNVLWPHDFFPPFKELAKIFHYMLSPWDQGLVLSYSLFIVSTYSSINRVELNYFTTTRQYLESCILYKQSGKR